PHLYRATVYALESYAGRGRRRIDQPTKGAERLVPAFPRSLDTNCGPRFGRTIAAPDRPSRGDRGDRSRLDEHVGEVTLPCVGLDEPPDDRGGPRRLDPFLERGRDIVRRRSDDAAPWREPVDVRNDGVVVQEVTGSVTGEGGDLSV